MLNIENHKQLCCFPPPHHEPRTLPTAGVDAAPFVPPIAALVAAFFAALVAALLPSVPSSVPSRVAGITSRFLPVSFLRHRLKSNDATRFRDMVRMEVWGFNGTLVYIHNTYIYIYIYICVYIYTLYIQLYIFYTYTICMYFSTIWGYPYCRTCLAWVNFPQEPEAIFCTWFQYVLVIKSGPLHSFHPTTY